MLRLILEDKSNPLRTGKNMFKPKEERQLRLGLS
jgi:hypothetical protein